MGRMLDVLRLTEVKRVGDAMPGAAAEDEHFVSDFANEEVPFIEVGPAGSLEASSAVLSAAPRLRIAPRPPADAGPLLDLGPDPAPPALGVSLRPLPGSLALLPPGLRFSPDLVAFHRPDDPAGAEYRQLAAALLPKGRTLLFIGAAPGVGTTTVVLNLAVCLTVNDGLRVVVVDAASARPAVGERLGVLGALGLADVLAGNESVDRALQETGLPHLTVLTSGHPEHNRAVLPVAEVCRPVLRLLRDRFDVVLIDAGAEVSGLGRACDAAYLVTRHSEADAASTVERARALLSQGAPLRGCVLTGN
jgi:Mrp family chromosome partitioning ATPase